MRVLVLGAAGMLAREILARAPRGMDVHGRTRTELDVTDADAVRQTLGDVSPDVVINGAAYTDVDGAERDAERTHAVNGRAPGLIGEAARNIGAAVVHFSTDYVFDGASDGAYAESCVPAPLGVYGASKLAGETALAGSGARYLIIRTQWLFGIGGRSFPRTMWERATAGLPTRVVHDQVGRPTYAADLARAAWELSEMAHDVLARMHGGEASGCESTPCGMIVHVANRGKATWLDVARRVFDSCGRGHLLTPCSTAEYPTAARRPRSSVLATERYARLSGRQLPHWKLGIDRLLARLAGTPAQWTSITGRVSADQDGRADGMRGAA